MQSYIELIALIALLNPLFTLVEAAPSSSIAAWRAKNILLARQDNGDLPDPNDQSWIQKWAAIGDSYSAGIGAGSRTDRSCSRYNHSYPALINNDARMGQNSNQKFQFLSCSGALSTDVLKKQVPSLDSGLDAVMISAGGNDVGLSTALNDCVFGWLPRDPSQCDKTLDDTQSKINKDLPGNIDQLLSAVQPKLSKDGKIYLTGYAKFFDATTSQCDGQSWDVWPQLYPQVDHRRFLTQARRKRMNDLVDAVNQKLEAAVKELGDKAVFVDYDRYYTELEGRYCENSVQEPSASRDGLLFYERGTNDPSYGFRKRDDGDTSDDSDVADGTFEGQIATWVGQTLQQHPELKSDLEGGEFEVESNGQKVNLANLAAVPGNGTAANSKNKVNLAAAAGNGTTANSNNKVNLATPGNGTAPVNNVLLGLDSLSWIFPDTMKRVFHPRPRGHAVIANLVLWHMRQERAKALGEGDILSSDEEETWGVCPLVKTPPPLACNPSSDGASNLPAHIFAYKGDGGVMDTNQILFKMRERFCSNDCDIPKGGFPWDAVSVQAEGGKRDARCEVSIGVEGGIEIYMSRDRSVNSVEEANNCWDSTAHIINDCIRDTAREGWQNGVDPAPGFYQAGIRKLNNPPGKHNRIQEDKVLKKSLADDFQSICGKGDGPCQKNGCAGTWNICSAGTYKGEFTRV
ncbi:MAG: hypothetical protein Q9160_003789 [Pyrenula sp. 1 TL-2023]